MNKRVRENQAEKSQNIPGDDKGIRVHGGIAQTLRGMFRVATREREKSRRTFAKKKKKKCQQEDEGNCAEK